MTESIISNDKRCYVCGKMKDLHRHHCFYGTGNREMSEKYGLWVYLCPEHHNVSNYGVHFNKPFDTMLKRYCQMIWERQRGTREQFREIFGKSYL